jgi:N-acetylglutamate synthase-like GNAT family acetyltransferase
MESRPEAVPLFYPTCRAAGVANNRAPVHAYSALFCAGECDGAHARHDQATAIHQLNVEPAATLIRRATDADRELLAHLIRTSFADVAVRFGLTPQNCPTHPSNCTPAWIDDGQSHGVAYFVLEYDQAPVGCVAMKPLDDGGCELMRLGVLPEHRRRSLGEALVRHVLDCAADQGFTQVRLAIIADHDELRRWYQCLGFCAVETRSLAHLPFRVAFLSRNVCV